MEEENGNGYVVRPYRNGEERYVASAHKRVYAEEYGWGPAFSDYAMKIALDFAGRTPEAGEGMWIAERQGRPVGSVMLCGTEQEKTGQLRLFLVEKEARRFGIGSALFRAALEAAEGAGYEHLLLWTAAPLTDAIRLYEKNGFRETERTENRSWRTDGSPVSEIRMDRDLTRTEA